MANIKLWEPFREARRMHDMLDRMMDRSLIDPFWSGAAGTLPIDMYQTDDEIIVKASAPGLTAEDLDYR